MNAEMETPRHSRSQLRLTILATWPYYRPMNLISEFYYFEAAPFCIRQFLAHNVNRFLIAIVSFPLQKLAGTVYALLIILPVKSRVRSSSVPPTQIRF